MTVLISCCVILIGLGLFAYIGFYNRYWSDDWCYNLDFKNLGAITAVKTYFSSGEDANRGYATNRYSLTLLSGLFYLPGIFGTQIIALLIIVLLLGGLLWIGLNLSKIFGQIPNAVGFLGVVFLLYYVLYLAPDRFEILYWRSGVHYSFTIILGLYIFGLITRQMGRKEPDELAVFLVAPLAFVAGGLSETGCAFLVSMMVLMLAAAWVGRRKQADWALKSYPTILIAFIFLLASMLVLIVSPSNSRYSTMGVKSTSMLLIPFISFEFSLNFIVDSLKSLPLPHVIIIGFFAALSILCAFLVSTKRSINFKGIGLSLLVIAIITFLLIAAVQAPSVEFYSSYPEPRAQSLSRFTMLSGLAVMAWLIGQAVFIRWHKEWLVLVALIGIGLGTVYTARLITLNYAQLPGYVYRSKLWDQRDRDIKLALSQGQKIVEVTVIDTHDIGVQDIMRSKDMRGEWVRNCGSDYYGLDAIKAIAH